MPPWWRLWHIVGYNSWLDIPFHSSVLCVESETSSLNYACDIRRQQQLYHGISFILQHHHRWMTKKIFLSYIYWVQHDIIHLVSIPFLIFLFFLQGWIDIWHVLAIYRMFHSLFPSCVFPFFLLTFIQHCMGLKGYENYIQFILYMPILLSKCVWRFLYFQTATCTKQICFLWMILLWTIAKSFSSFLSWKTCDEKFIRLEIDYFSVLILSNGI